MAPETWQIRCRTKARLTILVLGMALGPGQGEALDQHTRIDGLEARLEGLTRRVQAIEALLKESDTRPGTGASSPKGEPAWELDPYTGEAPFRVLHRSLDRSTGRIDLLLDVTASIPDAARWSGLQRGDAVPLALTLEPESTGAGVRTGLVLERAVRIEPGSRVHISARIAPEHARTVLRVRIGRAPDTWTPPQAKEADTSSAQPPIDRQPPQSPCSKGTDT